MTNEEPYRVQYHREHQEKEAAVPAKRNPPPPKATGVVPLRHWQRTITWWPKYDWERYDTITHGDDLSPADRGHKLREIQDMALLGKDEDGFPVTSVEASYTPYLCEERPQDCGYTIIHKANTPDEEVVCEGGFDTIDDTREGATRALAYILQHPALA
jgi:hypothetical protein